MKFTEKIEALMREKGIKNNKELSELSGIPYTTIDGLFKKGGNPKLHTLKALKKFFGCSLDYLADDSIEERREVDAGDVQDLGEILKTAAVITMNGSELTAGEVEEIKNYIRYGVMAKRAIDRAKE